MSHSFTQFGASICLCQFEDVLISIARADARHIVTRASLLDTLINSCYGFDHEYEEIDTTTRIDFGTVSLRNFVMEKHNL